MSNSKPGMKRMEDSFKTFVQFIDILRVYMSYLLLYSCDVVDMHNRTLRLEKITPLLGLTNLISCFTDYFYNVGSLK